MLQAILLASVGLSAGQVEQPIQKVYNVADLVVPVAGWNKAKDPERGQIQDLNKALARHIDATTNNEDARLDAELIEAIRKHIEPESWSGKQASIQYFPLGMALVVLQTPKVHAEIAEFLTELRQLQEVEVSLETRLITVIVPEGNSRDSSQWTETLNAEQVKALLAKLEADAKTEIMQGPKLTVFNGQRATVSVSDNCTEVKEPAPQVESREAGLRATFLPTVSPDRRTVRLHLDVDWKRQFGVGAIVPVKATVPDSGGKEVQTTIKFQQPCSQSFGVRRTFKLADGQTILIHGGQFSQPAESPAGAKRRETKHVLILVTPRIVVVEEDEFAKLNGKVK